MSCRSSTQRKACRDTAELNHRHQGNQCARGGHGDRPATQSLAEGLPSSWQGKMLRGGYKASERRRHLSDRLSRRQDQALSSSIYLLREMGPTAFLLREEEPENKDFRVTTAPTRSQQAGSAGSPQAYPV